MTVFRVVMEHIKNNTDIHKKKEMQKNIFGFLFLEVSTEKRLTKLP